ncbi:LysM peptidoglycan-binding domain-containing protein [Polaribacter sp.]|uniref:PBP1 and LysM peptidoglycan-binding domain-containing protein n=1 Tax=Polaribacter sp. TaxID=1920175 RepID=UPI003EF641F9
MKHLKFFVFLCVLTFTVSCGQQKKYVEYQVKEGESISSIAKRLAMNTKDLFRLNPGVKRRPVANTVIIVPNKKMAKLTDKVDITNPDIEIKDTDKEEVKEKEDKLLEELRKEFVVHVVKPKETIYGLKRFYNVTEEDLLLLNPSLSEGLKIGQIIKIKPIVKGEEIVENNVYEDIIDRNSLLKVALLLPFKTIKYDTVSSDHIFSRSKLANIVTDFYLGAEIAIDSLRKQGVKIELNVFDTGTNRSRINAIIASENLNDNSVIIGPLYSEEAEIIAKKVDVPVIFPLYSRNQYKFTSSKIIKSSPEKKVFRDELVSYIKDNFNTGNLIIVGDGKSASNSAAYQIQQALITSDSISKVHILKPENGYIKKDRFLSILKPNQKNWVILSTNDNVIMADAINSLISLPEETTVKVFTYDKGVAFDKIDNLKLAKIGFTYVSDEYVDEKSKITQLFNKQYSDKNNALPSDYATKGFDITYDILIRLASGNNLKSTFKEGASFRIESKFDYHSKLFGVSENNGLFILQYNPDLSLIRLK